MSDALILRDDKALRISFTEAANALREDALAQSSLIGKVVDAETNAAAAEAHRKLAELRRTVEKARSIAKAPVLEFGKDIDTKAKEFVAEIVTEEMRITKLVGDFFALENAKRQAGEAAARLEAERIENARRAEEQRIHREALEREAIERRKQEALASKARAEAAEAQRKINEATNAKQRAIAEAAADKQREESARAAIELNRQRELANAETHAQLDAAQERASNAQAAVVVQQVAPVAAAGQTVKKDITVEVTDIHMLARVHPGLVNIEPRIADIKSAILAGAKIAGVSSREIFKSSVRSSSGMKAIDV